VCDNLSTIWGFLILAYLYQLYKYIQEHFGVPVSWPKEIRHDHMTQSSCTMTSASKPTKSEARKVLKFDSSKILLSYSLKEKVAQKIALGETRTPTSLLTLEPESSLSTNFSTRAN
jgi:hypothetical protein